MDDYIKRESVINMLENAQIISNGEYSGYCTEDISIMSIPSADVRPVIHARWNYDPNVTDYGIGGYVCSVCKSKNNNLPCNRVKSISSFSGAKYCPNCGAEMIGVIK